MGGTCKDKRGDKCKGLQGRGGHSSRELGDKRTVKDCKAKADTAVQSWETSAKHCKAEAHTAAQSWETNVKDCKAEADTAVQRWETNVDRGVQM